MLAPTVWDFEPPEHIISIEKKNYKKEIVPSEINTHYYNHSVSVVLPNTASIPDKLQTCLLEDSDYYRINALRTSDLLNQEFVEAFVKRGEISLLTIGKNIDTSNSIAITPTGQLIISLTIDDYQRLGLEGKPSYFDRAVNTRYVVTIDLKAENFVPGKKNYERAKQCLNDRFKETFDVILIWEPPEEKNICPSSVAAWFFEHGYEISLCQQEFFSNSIHSLNVPVVSNEKCKEELFEWLGMISISGYTENENSSEYVNSYHCPSPFVSMEAICVSQWTGFLSRNRLKRLFNKMKEFKESNNLSWCSLHVQGFTDSPVSWNLQEHTFYSDGDNSYTIIFHSENSYTIRKTSSSNNKVKRF